MPVSKAILQAAAIPIDDGRICLVNSSSGRGWTVPKGHIESGLTARETALQEAWEEAGLRGTLDESPVGSYRYEKNGDAYHVVVFTMQVTGAAERWPEADRRTRRWVRPHELDRLIQVPGLRRVLGRVQLPDYSAAVSASA